jgi:hypothetical protein
LSSGRGVCREFETLDELLLDEREFVTRSEFDKDDFNEKSDSDVGAAAALRFGSDMIPSSLDTKFVLLLKILVGDSEGVSDLTPGELERECKS